MAQQFDQLKRMREKAERLQEKARQARNPKMAEKYLRQADSILVSIQAIIDNWKAFGESARGNTYRRGKKHTAEAKQKMSEARKALWESKSGREKMWRARRARQFREKGKCLIRFPRFAASEDKRCLRDYRKKYKNITGISCKIHFDS